MADDSTQDTTQDPQDTQDQGAVGDLAPELHEKVEALVTERLAAAKAEQDKAFSELWEESKRAKAEAKAEAERLRQERAALEEERKAGKAGITSEQLEKLRADVRKNLEAEFTPVIEEKQTLAQQLEGALAEIRGLRLDSRVKAKMGEMGVRSDRIDKLFKLTQDQYTLTDDGNPVLKDEPTADLGKFISESLRGEYPEWFNGSGASGGGASPSTVGGGGKTVIPHGDNAAFLKHLDEIAKGEVEVR